MTDFSKNRGNQSNISRRRVLKNAGVVSGAVLVSAQAFSDVGAAQGSPPEVGTAGPCHKDFECEDGTYVKFEFIEEDGECRFEEETDTNLLEVTVTETKEESCEPISVEWSSGSEATGTVQVIEGLAFGGNTCDDIPDTHDGSYTSGLETEGGTTAAISNLQFCVVETVYAQIDFVRGDVIEDLCEEQYSSRKISSISWSSSDGQLNGVQGQFDGEFVLDGGTVEVSYDPTTYKEKVSVAVYRVLDPVFNDNGTINFEETRCRQTLVDSDTDADDVGALDGSLVASLPTP